MLLGHTHPPVEVFAVQALCCGSPVICADRRLAYDGRGNAVVRSAGELDAAVAALGGYEHGLYAERWCPYQKARTLGGIVT